MPILFISSHLEAPVETCWGLLVGPEPLEEIQLYTGNVAETFLSRGGPQARPATNQQNPAWKFKLVF